MSEQQAAMHTYLSFGGGVNSVAMYLLFLDMDMIPGDAVKGFEAIYVDHGCDWPETREYVADFGTRYPLTILTPSIEGFSNLYDYCWHKQVIPPVQYVAKWCTDKFKLRTIYQYIQSPCFMNIGFATDEVKRAKLNTQSNVENRWPLLESEMDRKDCVSLIKYHGLRIPPKSACWFCRNQSLKEWKHLRRTHPNLFCKAMELENRNNERRVFKGLKPIYLFPAADLNTAINNKQRFLFKEAEYPPCHCGL